MDKKTAALYKRHTLNNEIEIVNSKEAVCLFCGTRLSARKIVDWENDKKGVRALCPECGMTAVVGDASGLDLSPETVEEARRLLYGPNYTRHHPDILYKYISRYEEGKVTRNKENEALYLHYLKKIADDGHDNACFTLGCLYSGELQFHRKDLRKAAEYFHEAPLRTDAGALTHLGYIHMSWINPRDPEDDNAVRAMQYFTKAQALGDQMASLFLSDLYIHGLGIYEDVALGAKILEFLYPENYSSFYFSEGNIYNVFPHLCYRLGYLHAKGIHYEKNNYNALHYLLLAELAFKTQKNLADSDARSLYHEEEKVEALIEEIAKEENFVRGEPYFDSYTFDDSLEEDGEMSLAHVRGSTPFLNPVYDPDRKIFSFDLGETRFPMLLVDTNNLYAGFQSGTTHWEFENVSKVELSEADHYDYVRIAWGKIVFMAFGPRGNNRPVCTITFESKEEETPFPKTKGSKA